MLLVARFIFFFLLVDIIKLERKFIVVRVLRVEIGIYIILVSLSIYDIINNDKTYWLYIISFIVLSGLIGLILLFKSRKRMGLGLGLINY